LKGVILQNNIPLDRFKTFPALVKDILGLKKNVSNAIIEQIKALHDLRNNVQHQAVIPSLDEVIKHRNTVSLFIDDICNTFYNNSITFDSISLNYLVDTQIERIILDEMEKAISELG
jgi:hypothetical protein